MPLMARKSNFRSQAHRPAGEEHIDVAGALLMLVVLALIVIASGLGLPPGIVPQ
jgi:hypothetical protein